jgi:hypothetical protein
MSTKPLDRVLPNLGITIREGDTVKLAHYNEQTGEIVIRRDLPRVGKHISLIHELLHAADVAVLNSGETKRRIPHAWITNAAPILLLMLVELGVYPEVTALQMKRFFANLRKQGKP